MDEKRQRTLSFEEVDPPSSDFCYLGLNGSQALPSNWQSVVDSFFETEQGKGLLVFLQRETEAGEAIFPPADLTYAALQSCDLPDVKVVILGQDPYHGPGQAHGLAFSVPAGVKLPPSLRNIYKELADDIGVQRDNGDLTDWAGQGVLLLNTTLTVRRAAAGSHAKKGWEKLTDSLVKEVNQNGAPCVFILWGKDAITKAKWIDEQKHLVITSPHPSPLSAYRGFFGSRPFSQANTFLEEQGRAPIRW